MRLRRTPRKPEAAAQSAGAQTAIRRAADTASAADTERRRISLRTLVRVFHLSPVPRWAAVTIGVLTLSLTASALVTPKVTQWAIDDGLSQQAPDVLAKAALIVLGLCVFGAVAGYGQQILVNRVGQNAMDDLRRRVFEHMQSLSLDFYERREPGKLISRLTSDIDSVNELLRMLLTGFLADFPKAIGVSAMLFAMHWKLALLVHVLLPAIIGLLYAFRKYGEIIFRRVRETLAGISSYLHETITGVRVIKAFAREERSQRIFAELTEDHALANVAQGRLFGALFPAVQFVSALSLVIIFWYGGVLMSVGDLSFGTVFAFVLYAQMLFEPWRALADFAASIARAGVALDRIFDVLDEVPSVRDREAALVLPRLSREIRFEDVSFSYDGTNDVLHDVAFAARLGEVIALVGPTGAGKSTIAKLVSRLYDVERGRITFDGVDIRDATTQSVRRQLGMVPQDPFLFAGSLRQNIAYGRDEATPEQVATAAEAARVTEFAGDLPDGLDTGVHERGVKLSDGQRQLVSLARALAADAAVLILDEATSSVDLFTESAVQQALETARPGRVTFIIAHRLATVRHADTILVVDGGRIIARGTHKRLLDECPLYRSLYLRRFEDVSEEERRVAERYQAREALAGT